MKHLKKNPTSCFGSLVAFMFLVLLHFSAAAQQGATQVSNPNDGVRATTERMAADLDLDDTQRKQLLEQNSAFHLNQQSIHQNQLTDQERLKMRQDHQRSYENNLRNILNADQLERYNQKKSNYQLDFPREQRATPTREGTPAKPRHNR